MTKYLKQHPKWNERDYFPTIDKRASEALAPFISNLTYGEPCYGAGHLENLFTGIADCVWRSDIEPQVEEGCITKSALDLTEEDVAECDVLVTNPPFDWKLLKPILDHLPKLKPTWLLLPADKMHTKQMSPYLNHCSSIVSVGRLKFFLDNDPRLWDNETQSYKKNSDPTINFAWFLFDYYCLGDTYFYERCI